MEMNKSELLAETEKLKKMNSMLQRKLRLAMESIEAIKDDTIDALVMNARENAIKVYTEKTADKPYRILIEKMHEGAVMLSDDGVILYCNAYFAHMVNLPLEKVFGTDFEDYIDDSSKEQAKVLLFQSRSNATKEEINIHFGNGKKIPVLMTINSLTLDNSMFLGIILTDLTFQYENQRKLNLKTKQLEVKKEELENADIELAFQIREKKKRSKELRIAKTDVKDLEEINTHKDSVLAMLSHDLRSPLAAVIGIAEYLNTDYDTLNQSEIKHMLASLLKETTNEMSMLDNLLEWGRIKFASEAFSPENVILARFVTEVFDILKEVAVKKNIQLNNKIDENIVVFADENMLLSILQNIVSNAIKHTPANGEITVSSKMEGDKVITEVKDTGVGMSKDMTEKLFTPQITSLLNPRKTNKGGGIGLLLVKEFLDKNSGEIWVESEEGKGSSFYFSLIAG